MARKSLRAQGFPDERGIAASGTRSTIGGSGDRDESGCEVTGARRPDDRDLPTPGTTALLGELAGFRDRLRRVVDLRMDPRIRGRVDASDVIQETLIEANRRLPEYRADPPAPFYLWVRYLALQKLLQLRRHHVEVAARDARREVRFGDRPNAAVSSMVLARHFVESCTTPSQHLAREEEIERVRTALDGLKEIDREIIALRHFERLSNGEIARVLEIEESTASQRYLRALRRLKATLGADGTSRDPEGGVA